MLVLLLQNEFYFPMLLNEVLIFYSKMNFIQYLECTNSADTLNTKNNPWTKIKPSK